MNFNKRSLASPLLALALLASPTLAEGTAVAVEVADVSEGVTSAVVRLPGTVISTRDAMIATEISGRLTWVAQVGQQVAAGDAVARIDDHRLQLQLRDNEAEIARLEADIQYNQRQIGRLEKLAITNNMAQSELDQVRSQLEMLLQQQRIAEVARDRTRYDLELAQVRAPFPGVVASREMMTGEYTNIGAAIVRLVDTQALEVSVNAPLRAAHFNELTAEVQVEAGDRRAMAPIRGMVPVGDSRSRMMELRLAIPAGNWLIGEAVTVEIPDGETGSALSVPRDALVLRDKEAYVYTVSAEGTAVKVPVQPLAGRGSMIAVDGELNRDDQVVVRGAERLQEGQQVRITQGNLAGVWP
ncbi:hypothetical protein C0029_12130 [Halioglobus japonicus]|uniref:YknX-like C-terminal permuted SH3-like domain-containing protein n=1 Tax=Halioglobus japonicus TaxID=930805 RepID=A0AAP8MCZ7_9GAMM|nr:efflux RND transporter periplasmic adaptor subunit [Halioglobus japonicus]PLW85374.1 hypothetical protein C0029_12130 [Halioglobus japonicus]